MLMPLLLMITEPVTRFNPCPSVEQVANDIMEARQKGVPMSRAMEIAASVPNAEPLTKSIVKLVRLIIIAAYEKPRMVSEEEQLQQREDFATEMAVICYQNMEQQEEEQ
ncbi:MAG: hypothetical protein K2X29_02420 [Candidatus Obscuribacterales bacterium]|nr:hypothetical protein [Candidatus Obscuribacterales bacterium]